MRIGGDDSSFFGNAVLIALLAAVSAVGISQTMHGMKNVTYKAPPAVHTASAVPR